MAGTATADRPVLDLRGYLSIFARRRWVILLVTVVVVAAAGFWSTRQDKVYEASGQVVIQADSAQPSAIETEAKIIESPAVHAKAVATKPGIGTVSTSTHLNDNVITVTSQSSDPKVAAETVNAHMNAYIDYSQQAQADRYTAAVTKLTPTIANLDKQIADLAPKAAGLPSAEQQQAALTQQNLSTQKQALQNLLNTLYFDTTIAGSRTSIVAEAVPPTSPISPKPKQDVLIALGAGLLLGIALAFVLEFLDDSIRNRDDLAAATGATLPVLGSIPRLRSTRDDLPVSVSAPSSAAAEAFRSLRTAVYFSTLEVGNSIEVTSPRAQEGKSTTCVNLAIAAARSGKAVLLVDCDLRRPTVHHQLGLANDAGFTSVFLGESVETVMQSVPGIDNLKVLTSGPLPPNPSELLTSSRGRDVLESLRSMDALVLFDTPPLLGLTDAAAVAAHVDGVLLVAKADYSTRRSFRSALELLAQVGVPTLGTVLTRAKDDDAAGSYVYTYRAPRRFKRSTSGEPEAEAGW